MVYSTQKVIIAVDAMGGDNAPGSVIEGVKLFLAAHPEAGVRVFGKTELLGGLKNEARVEIIDCRDEITMHDEPMMAVRRKPDSSLVRGLRDVKEGLSQAFVSAGSTGALFIGAMVTLRMLKGISRPALAPVLPGLNAPFLLIDSGANADCQSAYLKQFGLMGSVYMNWVMGVEDPKVGLVNIGVEEEKGSKLYKDAFKLMSEQSVYTFAGNCEAREIQKGDFDVVVADGFTGNVILKYAEGFASCMMKVIKREILSTFRGKLGGLMLKPAFKNVKKQLTTDEYGGAPLLGVDGVVVKAHGSSGGYAFSKALEQTLQMVSSGMLDKLKDGINKMEATQNDKD